MSDREHHAPSDSANLESIRSTEALMVCIARLKLRLEVGLRRDRDVAAYKAMLASCLDDVDDIVQAAEAARVRASRRGT